MTTEDSAARFLELENSASSLLSELERLRQESIRYDQASTSLESVEQNVRELATSLSSAAEKLQSLVAGLGDIGMPGLLDKITGLESDLAQANKEIKEAQQESAESLATLKKEIDKVNERSTERLDALIEYHSRGILGKLFGKPRPIDPGLS